VVALHSVYEHLDKTICTAPDPRGGGPQQEGQGTSCASAATRMPVFVVPHGCFRFPDDASELWNIFHNAVHHRPVRLRLPLQGRRPRAGGRQPPEEERTPSSRDIFYCYLCSENPHNCHICTTSTSTYLQELAGKLGIADNVAVIRGYQDEKIINTYLRTAKLAIFPYKNNPDNVVYGASGAIRIAMANRIADPGEREPPVRRPSGGVLPQAGLGGVAGEGD
jgi:hypothetical protein